MATRSFVPHENGEGSLGTAENRWGDIYTQYGNIQELTVNTIRSSNGTLLSYSDKNKLDNLENTLSNYLFPTASYTDKGNVIIGENLTVYNGTLSVSKHNIVTALGYTPNTPDEVEVKINNEIMKYLTSNQEQYDNIKQSIDYILNNGSQLLTLTQDVNNLKETKQNKDVALSRRYANQAVGAINKPVFINAEGIAVETEYNVFADVPENAKFTDTTYEVAQQTANGLMSAVDKTKLDNIEDNANNYVLPIASSTELGGIKVGDNLTIFDGILKLTSLNVIRALGFEPPRINTWRNIQDNLTSDETEESLSAKQGKVLKEMVDGKADTAHNHNDDYYTKKQIDEKLSLIGTTVIQNGRAILDIGKDKDDNGLDYFYVKNGTSTTFEKAYLATPTICDGVENVFIVTSTGISPNIGAKVTNCIMTGLVEFPWRVVGWAEI